MRRQRVARWLCWTVSFVSMVLEDAAVAGSSSAVEREPMITPHPSAKYAVIDGHLVFQQGANISLDCQAVKPIKWKLPSISEIYGKSYNSLDEELARKAYIESSSVIKQSYGYRYSSTLIIASVSHLATGYFVCHHADTDENDADASSKIYIFITGSSYQNVMAIPGTHETPLRIAVKNRTGMVVPCRPSHPTVQIALLNARQEVVQKEGNWTYDPRSGFTLLKPPLHRSVSYFCQVVSWYTPTRLIIFNITDPAYVMVRPLSRTETDVVDGSSVTWVVQVDAFPGAIVTWYDSDGSKIGGLHGPRHVDTDLSRQRTSLTLTGIERFHAGQYRLEVAAEDRKQSIVFILRVKYLPKVRIPHEVNSEKYVAQGHNLGENFWFEWAVEANPAPEIVVYFGECTSFEVRNDGVQCNLTWISNESIYSGTKRMNLSANDEFISVHQKRFWFGDGTSVNLTGKANVAGDYLCRACNEVSNGFDLSGPSKHAFLGDGVDLICGASFHLYRAGVTWTWTTPEGATITVDRNNLPPGSRLRNETKYRTSVVEVLHWAAIPLNAAGMFTCRVTTLQNTTEEKSFELFVSDIRAPKMTADNQSTWVTHGKLFELICPFIGKPYPTVRWTKDDRVDFPGEVTTESNKSTLRVYDADSNARGIYRCTVTNRLGAAQMEFALGVGLPVGIIAAIVIGALIVAAALFALLTRTIRRLLKRRRFSRLHQLNLFHKGDVDGIDPDMQLVYQTHLIPYDKQWEVSTNRLSIEQDLSTGAFGQVLRGFETLRDGKRRPVTIKMISRQADDMTPLKNLMCELKILIHAGAHLNVLNVLGASTKNLTQGRLLVVYDDCGKGNLRDYLIYHRKRFINQVNWAGKYTPKGRIVESPVHQMIEEYRTSHSSNPSAYPVVDNDSPETSISTSDLLCWVFQIACGMKHLGNRKIVHGDLAARNIILVDENVVKIADVGLARQLWRSDHFVEEGKKGILPARWLAPEVLLKGIFSTKSDVWSFGILMWELFTLGGIPYQAAAFNEALVRRIVEGHRMEKPRNAPNNIYSLMGSCWRLDPAKRPKFSDLEDFLAHPLEPAMRQRYVDLNEVHVQERAARSHRVADYLNLVADVQYLPPSLSDYHGGQASSQ